MVLRCSLVASISLFALTLGFTPARAEEEELSPEAKAMMEAWQNASTPNENHQLLGRSVGNWNFTSSWWPNPEAPPTKSEGTATYEMILGGRYLKETVRSEMRGESFEGIGYTGYDNVKKSFVSTWMDNMSTGILVSEGSWDAETKTYTWHGDYVDVMTGKSKQMRVINRIESADRQVAEFFDTNPDGREYKSMEIIYTRQ
jgi:hypothetical protein